MARYYDYTPDTAACYAFVQGDGYYTVTLYRNISGTTYTSVASRSVMVELADDLLPYLVSTTEITFSEDDAVGQKAAELCEGLTEDADKVVAIYNYIAENFKYDYIFAYAVKSGAIKSYVPNTSEVLEEQRGVCYDFSALFAAMCRSQDIPCAVAKGYISSGYHAWNMVWLDDAWVAVDLTNAIAYRACHAEVLSDCMVSLEGYQDYTY